jgi:allantoicase
MDHDEYPAVDTRNMDEETAARIRKAIQSESGDWEKGWSIRVRRKDDGRFLIEWFAPDDGNPRGVTGSQPWWKRLQMAGFDMEPAVHLGVDSN